MKVLFVCAFLLATLAVPFMAKVISERERYIVLLKEGATDEQIEEVIQMVEGHEASPREELFIQSDNTLLPIFYGEISEETANKISMSDIVDVVEKDEFISADRNILDEFNVTSNDDLENTQYPVWISRYNLDIIDDVNCIDGTYVTHNYGYGADIYVLDTGINYDHVDFGWGNGFSGTRAQYGGYDAVDADTGSTQKGRDCHGHGTHAAGISGGLYSGVAKDANLYSIRVLNCQNDGLISWLINGITAASFSHILQSFRPKFVGSIINMPISRCKSQSLNIAVNAAVKKGIIVVTASGNQGLNACNFSPGSAGSSINVGAHGYVESTCKKPMATFSNYGPCVDILAPGINILSPLYDRNTGFATMSGTGMASSHVAGLAAILKVGDHSLTPIQVKDRIRTNGIDDINRSAMSPDVVAISHAKRMYIFS